jgi:hypothetical protein
MTAPLYALSSRYQQLLELAEQGEDVGALLAELDDAIETKGKNIACILRQLDLDELAADSEAKRLAARSKAFANSGDRLRAYLKSCMETAGIRQIKSAQFSITLSPGQDRVEVVSLDAVPAEYVRAKTTREPDKRAILDAYRRDGECVPGVEIVPTTTLRVR